MTLVILAAGLGSRFGGLKQIEPVDDEGNFIIDYSVKDAVCAGFDKIVFVIKEENYELFKNTIGSRVSKLCKVEYAFQRNDNLEKYISMRFKHIILLFVFSVVAGTAFGQKDRITQFTQSDLPAEMQAYLDQATSDKEKKADNAKLIGVFAAQYGRLGADMQGRVTAICNTVEEESRNIVLPLLTSWSALRAMAALAWAFTVERKLTGVSTIVSEMRTAPFLLMATMPRWFSSDKSRRIVDTLTSNFSASSCVVAYPFSLTVPSIPSRRCSRTYTPPCKCQT